MSTIQIECLWQFIQSLNLSKHNRKWLAEKLIESDTINDTEKQKVHAKTEYELAWEEVEKGQVSEPFTSADELFKHLGI